jgi:hypothetical protein
MVAMTKTGQSLSSNYEALRGLSDAQQLRGNLDKFANPTLLDVGPGNIKIRTAMDLLNDYFEAHPDNDPLGLAIYRDDPARLTRDLVYDPDVTVKIEGITVTPYPLHSFAEQHTDHCGRDAAG